MRGVGIGLRLAVRVQKALAGTDGEIAALQAPAGIDTAWARAQRSALEHGSDVESAADPRGT